MKYCLNCGRQLFDRDQTCDKCVSTFFLNENECNKIIKKFESSNSIKQRHLMKNDLYKRVYELIINKEVDNYTTALKIDSNETDEEYLQRINEHTINSSKNQIHIQCPYCHSSNITKIDTFDRVISTGLFGLASKKLGKQWHCNTCKSDF